MKVLVVEDSGVNRKAAEKYFSKREDVKVDFAPNYTKGLQVLREREYDAVLIDLEIPRAEGNAPEELGFELAREAEESKIPWAIITAGFFAHHQKTATFAFYFWQKGIPAKEILIDKPVIETSKRDPAAWKRVFETLMNPFGESDPVYLSLKRINPKNPIQVLLTPIGRLTREMLQRKGGG